MFTEIHGLPIHPLAVHAAVVLVPLAALMGVLFAWPRTRAWSRLPLVLVSLAAVLSVFVARESGLKLKDHLAATGHLKDLVDQHQSRANTLFIIVIIFAVIAIAAYVVSRMANVHQVVSGALSLLLVVGAVGLAVQTYRVGELGSKIVWNPDGNVDFGSSDK
jgi:predicted MFS family arabinose efflux permease